jgi:ATP-dependent protease HslVU (ClpYQ) peptidase subunit
MTTIAARNDDGAITMAADSQLSGADFAYGDPVRKILHGDGFLLGLSGPVAILQQIERCMQLEAARYPLTGSRFTLVETMRLLHGLLKEQALIRSEHNAEQTEDSHFNALIANRTGLYTVLEDRSVVGPQKFWAIGSGWRFAVGALAAGVTAQRAVLAAGTLDHSTNTHLQIESITTDF